MFFPIYANSCSKLVILADSQPKSYKKNVLYQVKRTKKEVVFFLLPSKIAIVYPIFFYNYRDAVDGVSRQ